MSSSLGLATFSQTPHLPSPSVSSGLPTDLTEEKLRLMFNKDKFFIYWDSEFARIGCRTHFNGETSEKYPDPICKDWAHEFRRARRACRAGKNARANEELHDIRELFAEYRRKVQSVGLGLEGYLKAIEKSKDSHTILSSKDRQRYKIILKMLPSLERRFRDLSTIASGALLNDMKSLVQSCCAAIEKASRCLHSLTREASFNAR